MKTRLELLENSKNSYMSEFSLKTVKDSDRKSSVLKSIENKISVRPPKSSLLREKNFSYHN